MPEHVARTDDSSPAEPQPSNTLRWAFAIVAGLALAVVLVIGMNMWSTTYMVNENGDILIDGQTLESRPPASTVAARDSAFDYAIKTLASMRQESADELRDAGMIIDLPEVASDDNTCEELLGKWNSDLHSVVKVAQTDKAEARRLLPGIMSPDNTDDYTRYVSDIIGGGYGTDFVSSHGFVKVDDWSDNFYTSMVRGVEANGSAMRFMWVSTVDGFSNQVTFRRDEGEWVIHKMVPPEDNHAITDTFEFNRSIPR